MSRDEKFVTELIEMLNKVSEDEDAKYYWWYLSFVSDDFSGAAIVPTFTNDLGGAVLVSNLLEINPGGEVIGADISQAINEIPDKYKLKLLMKEESDEVDNIVKKLYRELILKLTH